MMTTSTAPVSILILGAGWTSTFLLPLLTRLNITHAATSTTGRPGTLPFIFSATSDDPAPYRILPYATTVLITFPLRGLGASAHLLSLYAATHPDGAPPQYIQLGSTGIFAVPEQALWVTRHSAYDRANERAVAEDELLGLRGCVLSLAGLWGGQREPQSWVARVAGSKERLGGKGSLHLVHGGDVARAVVAVSKDFTPGERWMVTDLIVYDWWVLAMGWARGHDGEEGENVGENVNPHLIWVQELMEENGIRALPRSAEQLGRCYDSREFWTKFKIMPLRVRA